MIPIASSTVFIQGVSYEMYPCSQFYWDRLEADGSKAAKKLEDREITQFAYWDILLKLIIKDEPKWDVNSKEFDGREAENVILAFMPPSMQARVLLLGFQPS